MGSIIGGLIAILMLSMLWEWALFKRVMDDPVKGKLSSVAAAWLTAGTLAGFGMADGGPFFTTAYLIYLLPALIIGGWAFYSGMKARERIEEEGSPDLADLADRFE